MFSHLQSGLCSALRNLEKQAKQGLESSSKLLKGATKSPKPLWARISSNNSPCCSLSIEEIEERLAGVPVYALRNPRDEFVLVSSGSKSLGLFCFKEEDVNTLLEQMKIMEPHGASKVVAVALNKVHSSHCILSSPSFFILYSFTCPGFSA